MSKNKVFVVTWGCYSDYRIMGIFSTKEEAELYRSKYDTGTYGSANELEEYVLDELTEEEDPFYSFYLTKTGDIEITHVSRAKCSFSDYREEEKQEINWSEYRHEPMMSINIQAKSREDAIKSAYERRAMSIANGDWDNIKQDKSHNPKAKIELSDSSEPAVFKGVTVDIMDFKPDFNGTKETEE